MDKKNNEYGWELVKRKNFTSKEELEKIKKKLIPIVGHFEYKLDLGKEILHFVQDPQIHQSSLHYSQVLSYAYKNNGERNLVFSLHRQFFDDFGREYFTKITPLGLIFPDNLISIALNWRELKEITNSINDFKENSELISFINKASKIFK